MLRIVGSVIALLLVVPVFAQPPKSPEELAKAVQALIRSDKIDHLGDLIHSPVDAKSLERLKASLAQYRGSKNLRVYIVRSDDRKAVAQRQADTAIAGNVTIQPLAERVKLMAAKGWSFTLNPLGDVVISGDDVNGRSSGRQLSVVYGKHGNSYLITLARKR